MSIGKKQEDTAYITAGDIGAVTKLTATQTGDTLCDPKKVVSFDPINFPRPCLSMAIKPQAKGDEAKVASSLQRLIEEDPTIAYENNAETHQQVITGLGEQHLDVLVSKLKNKFGVSVSLEVRAFHTARPSARRSRYRANTRNSPAVTASSATFGLSLSRLSATTSSLRRRYSAARFQNPSSRRLKRACRTASNTACWPDTRLSA